MEDHLAAWGTPAASVTHPEGTMIGIMTPAAFKAATAVDKCTVAEFAACLTAAGKEINSAFPADKVQEGTIVSVVRKGTEVRATALAAAGALALRNPRLSSHGRACSPPLPVSRPPHLNATPGPRVHGAGAGGGGLQGPARSARGVGERHQDCAVPDAHRWGAQKHTSTSTRLEGLVMRNRRFACAPLVFCYGIHIFGALPRLSVPAQHCKRNCGILAAQAGRADPRPPSVARRPDELVVDGKFLLKDAGVDSDSARPEQRSRPALCGAHS